MNEITTYQIPAVCQAWCPHGRALEVKEMMGEVMGGQMY